jgi:hypothetical protein
MGNIFTKYRKQKLGQLETYGDEQPANVRVPTKQEKYAEKIGAYRNKIANKEKQLSEKLSYMKTKNEYKAIKREYFKSAHPFIAGLEQMGKSAIANAYRNRINHHFNKHARRIGVEHRHLRHYRKKTTYKPKKKLVSKPKKKMVLQKKKYVARFYKGFSYKRSPRLKIGDKVLYSGAWGTEKPKKAVITGIDEKDNKKVYDTNIKHWGYAYQFKKLKS